MLTSAYHGSRIEDDPVDEDYGYWRTDAVDDLSDEDDPSRRITQAYDSDSGTCTSI